MAERHAEVSWRGSLMEGAGRIESTGSGAIGGLEVTWASRSEPGEGGRTSPEELIAAAHASCFCMALSHGLAEAGTPSGAAAGERDLDLRARYRHHDDAARGDGSRARVATKTRSG